MKKIKLLIVLLFVVFLFNSVGIIAYASTSGNNYILQEVLPRFSRYTYYTTASTPDIDSAIQSAMTAWNEATAEANGGTEITFFMLGSTTKELDVQDTVNTIGSMVSYSDIISSGGTATTIALNSMYINSTAYIYYSDIMFNSSYSFGNGMSQQYYDYQGILTHELGHTWGLADLYESSDELSFSTINDLPVMYGSVVHSSFSGVNLSIYKRYIKDGDIAGIAEVISLRNF